MGNAVLFTKLCNLFIPSAEGDPEMLPPAATGAVRSYKRKHGGLWVGGKVFVSEDDIQFVSNGVNIVVHSNVNAFHIIPWEWIRSVEWQFGILTGIVVVHCEDFDFRFRCFGAKGVVKRLAALIRSKGDVSP